MSDVEPKLVERVCGGCGLLLFRSPPAAKMMPGTEIEIACKQCTKSVRQLSKRMGFKIEGVSIVERSGKKYAINRFIFM